MSLQQSPPLDGYSTVILTGVWPPLGEAACLHCLKRGDRRGHDPNAHHCTHDFCGVRLPPPSTPHGPLFGPQHEDGCECDR